MNKNIIVVNNLTKKYKTTDKFALDGIDLKIRKGSIFGLLGPNGAGKTTCFYMILGITHPYNGDVFINNEKITRYPLYKRSVKGLSYLPQEASIFKKLTVSQNIEAILE